MAAHQYHLPLFDPSKVKPNCVWIILGPRNSGKSWLLKDILYKTRHNCDWVIAMTETEDSAESMREYMPSHMVYEKGYDAEVGAMFNSITKQLTATHKQRHAYIVEDDVMSDSKFLSSKDQMYMHLNGRHNNQTVFTTSQFPTCHPPKARSQADIVMSLAWVSKTDRKRMYDYYFGCFDKQAEFDRVFEKCTENYGVLVLDRTQPVKTVEGCIRHYRADVNIPPFRLGRDIFFRLSEHLDRENERKKQQIARRPSTTKVI